LGTGLDRINVAVIGCGSWGRNHIRVYNDLEKASLIAIADINEKVTIEFKERYSIEWYTEPEKIFKRQDIDAISICTPTTTHADLAIQAIEAGKHVLIEKPMTNTIREAKYLIKAASKHGVHLTVGFVERFNPAITKAMNVISEGEIGDIILAHTRRVSRRPNRIGDVGVIKDLAIHDIDIIHHLFKAEEKTVFSSAGCIANDFEDYANILVCYDDNKSAFIESNWLTPRKIRTLHITGTEGIINIEYTSQKIVIENQKGMYQPFLNHCEPLFRELESYVNSILIDAPPEVTGEDGLRALEISEAAILSAKSGKTISL